MRGWRVKAASLTGFRFSDLRGITWSTIRSIRIARSLIAVGVEAIAFRAEELVGEIEGHEHGKTEHVAGRAVSATARISGRRMPPAPRRSAPRGRCGSGSAGRRFRR